MKNILRDTNDFQSLHNLWKKPELNDIARNIWLWCIDRIIHLTAAHVAGSLNVEADEMSRKKGNDDLEWSFDGSVFNKLKNRHPKIEIDLFASRLNHKLPCYVSRFPEPDAWAVDAFSLTWSNNSFYIFPPFSLIPRTLQKLEEDRTTDAFSGATHQDNTDMVAMPDKVNLWTVLPTAKTTKHSEVGPQTGNNLSSKRE